MTDLSFRGIIVVVSCSAVHIFLLNICTETHSEQDTCVHKLLQIPPFEKAAIKQPHSASRGPSMKQAYPHSTVFNALIDHYVWRVILHRNLQCFHYTECPFEKIAFVFMSSATTAAALHCWRVWYLSSGEVDKTVRTSSSWVSEQNES